MPWLQQGQCWQLLTMLWGSVWNPCQGQYTLIANSESLWGPELSPGLHPALRYAALTIPNWISLGWSFPLTCYVHYPAACSSNINYYQVILWIISVASSAFQARENLEWRFCFGVLKVAGRKLFWCLFHLVRSSSHVQKVLLFGYVEIDARFGTKPWLIKLNKLLCQTFCDSCMLHQEISSWKLHAGLGQMGAEPNAFHHNFEHR